MWVVDSSTSTNDEMSLSLMVFRCFVRTFELWPVSSTDRREASRAGDDDVMIQSDLVPS